MVVLAIPLLVLLMRGIRGHYRAVDAAFAGRTARRGPGRQPIVIVPIARLDEPARLALAFANSVSAEATAVHVTNDADSGRCDSA